MKKLFAAIAIILVCLPLFVSAQSTWGVLCAEDACVHIIGVYYNYKDKTITEQGFVCTEGGCGTYTITYYCETECPPAVPYGSPLL